MKNYLYICSNVTNDVSRTSLEVLKEYSPEREITNRNPNDMAGHISRGFSICRQLRFSPELTAVDLPKSINNSEVAFASLKENVLALFKLTSNDLHTERKPYSTAHREWIIGNRWLVKTKAEKSFYHSYINSNLNRLVVMQGLKGVLTKK